MAARKPSAKASTPPTTRTEHDSLGELQCPVLFLSYEKALTRPRASTAVLADFCGIDADEDAIEAAAKTIQNGDQVYLG